MFCVNKYKPSSNLLVKMPRDGSCMYHSLSYLIHGNTLHSFEIRATIVCYVIKNWDRFQVWTHDRTGNNYNNKYHYQDDMMRPTTYGTACELKAAGELFPYNFKVYLNDELSYSFGRLDMPVKSLCFSGHISDGHYDAYDSVCHNDTMTISCEQIEVPVGLNESAIIPLHNKEVQEKLKPRKFESNDFQFINETAKRIKLEKPNSDIIKHENWKNLTKQEVRKKQLRDAAARYAKKHPLVHRKAATKYAKTNPDVNRAAVEKYTKTNPDVHRAAVDKYTKTNPDVNRAAVEKYTKTNPDVHRAAVDKYTKTNPDVHRAAVDKYTKTNPDVNRAAVKKYAKRNPGKNRAAVTQYDPLHEKRLLRKKRPWLQKVNSGFTYNPDIIYETDKLVQLGAMTFVCEWCNALKWKDEPLGMCCNGGKVHLAPFEKLPEPLNSLLFGQHPDSEHFLNSSRKYNSAFQMTSFGAKQIIEGNYMPTYKVQGQVYHLVGSLLPAPEEEAKFLQIYFIGDEDKETQSRCANLSDVRPILISQLQLMLHNYNNYIKSFQCAMESVSKDNKPFKVIIHADKRPSDSHKGCFNKPTSHEVAVIIVGQVFEKRDIILHSRNDKLQRISEIHRSYNALQYPLIFCRGEDGYSIAIPQIDPKTKKPLGKTVSASMFYSFRIMLRQGQQNHIHFYRSLLNQYLVDMYAKVETERLNFIRNNQKKLRAENYIHLKDAVKKTDANAMELGQIVILPSSFTGGPRYMHERIQDAMTYVRHYGRPVFFITFTCNPKWPEITDTLLPNQKAQDRPDIVARVFHLKTKKCMNLLTKGQLFGIVRCYMFTIEWQKRGLPHLHLLLWLEKQVTTDQIDDVIWAEIPNVEDDPLLHDIVKRNMIHGPCGDMNMKSPCMSEGKCSKNYPKEFIKDTQTGDDGFPKYRRRSPDDGGFTIKIEKSKYVMEVDNRWVVPYNPVLSRTFNGHINIEYCNSVKSIKYICKYVNKGSDQATFSVENKYDEITIYQTGRYISSSEAVWRILGFQIHERFPSIQHLAVHLENGQRIYFTVDNVMEKVNNPSKTTLIAFFELCNIDNFAKTLLYHEIPSYFVWRNNKFSRRKQGKDIEGFPGVKKDQVLGRVYTVHPNNSECYHLRLLLHEVRGPTSYTAIKTVNGIIHATFQSACKALGLLEDDSYLDNTLKEATTAELPFKLRELFAIILIFCQVSDPTMLWEKYKNSFSEDILYQAQREFPDLNIVTNEMIYNKTLLLLEDMIVSLGGHSLKQFGMPEPNHTEQLLENHDYLREVSYDLERLLKCVEKDIIQLTEDQKKVYFKIMDSIDTNSGKIFFLDAPGGTGKTYLLNLLLATVRSKRKIAIGVASSGIAATLLEGGKTAHAMFKLPLNLSNKETAVCNFSKQSSIAQVFRDCMLIVWDECTMSHKAGLEALNRTLQDIRDNNAVMGGITVLFAGDFRQTLPVIPRGTRADAVKACMKSSFLWPNIEKLSLFTNMRVHLNGDKNAGEFADLLLEIGNGSFCEGNSKIDLPKNLCKIVKTVDHLISEIYPDIKLLSCKTMSWLCERALLTPKNDTAGDLNDIILRRFEAHEMQYKSVDTVTNRDEVVNYPVEFLNSLNPPGMPAHLLTLKVGAPVMLLRNLNPPKLCNGTRLQIKVLRCNVIEATIMTGCAKGEIVFIPRIPVIPSDYPFEFRRLQFPIRVCFAMTINKSQGQTFIKAGIDLRQDCFSHGQLYVACSRVSKPTNLVILAPECKTSNVVYQEALSNVL